MDRDFWLGLWEQGRVPFHAHAVNPLLAAHLSALALPSDGRVFVPFCGKSVDIGWLRARGFRVAGAELSALAVEQLFDQLGERPEIAEAGPLRRFSSHNVEVFQGDMFELTREALGPVDAVYDRAALVALPADLRPRYAAHLAAMTVAAPQLLLSYVNSGEPYQGPPFPVGEGEIRGLYGDTHHLTLLAEVPDDGGEIDQVWRLERTAA